MTLQDSTLVYIVTVPQTARAFLRGHLSFMRERGFRVLVVASPGIDLDTVARTEKVRVFGIPMQREIDLPKDLAALWHLYRLLRREQPDIVNASTPKAGLLGMVAAWLACVPVRIYLVRGLRLETLMGFKRRILGMTERIATACAHRVICNSASLLQKYQAYDFAPARKLSVLGRGTSNGVDAERFLPSPQSRQEAGEIRKRAGIPQEAVVIGFVGRFTRDKGVVELVQAFSLLREQFSDLYLLMVGDFESDDPVPLDTIRQINVDPRIKLTGFVHDTAPYYHAMDILAFPSYREGFPNSPLEAGAAGIPTVGFRVTGVLDAVQDGKTGLLVPVGSVPDFAEALALLISKPAHCKQLGNEAQKWILQAFRPKDVWEAAYQEYLRLLRVKGLSALKEAGE